MLSREPTVMLLKSGPQQMQSGDKVAGWLSARTFNYRRTVSSNPLAA